jgi:DtxR family Mn-dependent transcriptional regulator
MINPFTALIIGAAVLAAVILAFVKGKDIIYKWRKASLDKRKVLVEDALKHLFDYEYKELKSTIDSVAGCLNISSNKAAELVSELEKMHLIISKGDKLQLTEEGRSYALQVIRVHRVLEKYFAEKTGFDEKNWHHVAELEEHRVTPDDANKLAAKIGNPIIDPHGDPIPTASGEIKKHEGVPLSNLEEGETAKIIHLEDEPDNVYKQLVDQGFHRGQSLKVMETDNDKIVVESEQEKKSIRPSFGNNITVVPMSEEEMEKDFRRLSNLKQGEEAEVIGISKALVGQQRRRLMDLGIVPGTKIKAELVSLSGDPVSYKIRDASIALRKKQTDMILVKEPMKESA